MKPEESVSSSDQSMIESSNVQHLEDSNLANSEIFSDRQSLSESVIIESLDESQIETPLKILKSEKPVKQTTESNVKTEAIEEKDSSKGMLMFKEIEI